MPAAANELDQVFSVISLDFETALAATPPQPLAEIVVGDTLSLSALGEAVLVCALDDYNGYSTESDEDYRRAPAAIVPTFLRRSVEAAKPPVDPLAAAVARSYIARLSEVSAAGPVAVLPEQDTPSFGQVLKGMAAGAMIGTVLGTVARRVMDHRRSGNG